MKLNQFDYEMLESIAKGIDKTLEITDLYLSADDHNELRRIIRKLKRDDKKIG